VLDGIKKRLKMAKVRWVEELSHDLWSYRTTPRKSTEEPPYALAYGMKAIIPLEVDLPTLRTSPFEDRHNNLWITRDFPDQTNFISTIAKKGARQKSKAVEFQDWRLSLGESS